MTCFLPNFFCFTTHISMKQTSNAIKFLLAQYRSIFKNAYFKGLATAVVITAGLAAGQAQAADIYIADGKDISTVTTADTTDGTTWALKDVSGSINGSGAAGLIGSGTSVSSGSLTIGNGADVRGVLNSSAFGGVIIDTTGGQNLSATNNKLTINRDGYISKGNAYGAYVNASGAGGNVYAEGNKLFINDGATVKASDSSGGNFYGARVVTSNGDARVTNNAIIINAQTLNGEDDSKPQGTTGIVGGMAEGTGTVNVTDNSVEINYKSATGTPDNGRLTIQGIWSVQGGFGVNQTSGQVAETINVTGNSVSIKDVDFELGISTKGAYIFGARAMNNTGADGNSTLNAANNTVTLNNTSISLTNNDAANDFQILGNIAQALNNTSSPLVDVIAKGDGTTANVSISGGSFSHASGGNAVNDVAGSIVAGGYAFTWSGSATADANVVAISDAKFASINLVGGYARGIGVSESISTSNNTITLSDIQTTNAADAFSNEKAFIAGAYANLSGAAAYSGAAITANSNRVAISNDDYNATTDTTDSLIGSVYGARIVASKSGATVIANNNAVEVGDHMKMAAGQSVYGVKSDFNGTFTGNSVKFGGKLNENTADAVSEIVGASITTGSSGDATTDRLTLTNNTVTLESSAKLTNVNLIAAEIGSNGFGSNTAEDDVADYSLVHSGNNVIADGQLVFNKGTGTTYTFEIKGDDTLIKSTAEIYVGRETNLNISGLSSGAGYFNGTGTVESGAKIANLGNLNIYNSLTVQGDDSLIAGRNGALLSVNAGKDIPETITTPVTEDQATLTISQAGLTNYLTAAADGTNPVSVAGEDVTDYAGAVQVTSGGTVAFTDASVVLSDFDFVKDTATAGKILVDGSYIENGSGSIFKANELTVAHAFASNATTYQDDNVALDAIGKNGIVLQANTLNLGADGLNSSDSAKILFDHALVKENINFNAATSGKDTGITSDVITNDGYHLTTTVIGSNFMKTNDQTSTIDYYTALDGNVNGQVKIISGGNLSLVDGHWTAHDQITVGASGTLSVGGDTEATALTGNNSLPDATLATSGVVLDVSEATTAGVATVQAIGRSGNYDIEVGDNRNVVLDLTSGLTMKGIVSGPNETIKGKANIKASNNGVVILNASDVNTILGQNHKADPTSGAFFTADGKGVLQVEGDIVATFGDFDGKPDTNGFNLAADGILDATSLTVQNANVEPPTGNSYQDDATYVAGADHIEFVGKVRVDDLVLNDEQLTVKSGGSTSYASQVTVGSGTMEVAKSISSVNGTVILGDAESGAHLELDSDAVGDEGTVAIDLLRVDSGSITVENGEWTARDITLNQSGAELTVGDDTEALDVNGDETASSLTLNKLTMAAGSTFNVLADGTATVASADFSALDTTGRVNVAGVLLINGVTADGDATNGVKFGDEGSISIENNGSLKFGKLAVNGAILQDGTYTGSTITLRDGYSKIANNGGELYLEFASGTSFDSDAILAFKEALFTTGSFSDGVLKSGGILNIGAASFEGFNITERLEGEGLDGYTATWEQVKDFSDIYGNDVTNDVKNIANIRDIGLVDQVQGSWGSFSMESGVANGAQVNIAGNTWLNYAAGNNGFFISNADHSAALGAKVGSQKSLYLIGGGTIGRITLEQGDDNVESNLTTLQISDGDTTIDSINAINSNSTGTYATQVNVLSNTIVTNDITDVGEVNVLDGATLTAANADINDLFVEESITNITGTLTVNGTTSYDGEALALGGQINAGSIVLEDGSDLTAIHDGTISAKTVTVDNSSTSSLIQVGTDIDTITETISNKHENSYYTGTGYFEVSDYLDLNGATLLVDPAYDENTSVAAVMNFKHDQDKTYDTVFNDVGIINGSVLVGKNAALGIGATLDETRKAIASYQQGGALKADQYGSILYLNGQLTVDENSEVALNSDANVTTLEGVRDSLKYTITSQVVDQYADLGLGNNTAILMTEAAFEDADGNRTGTAISFNTKGATVNSLGGDIVLAGTFDASEKLNIFDDADKDGVKVVGTTGIEVRTQNGFLYSVIELGDNKGKDIQLEVDKEHAYSIMSEASTPVVNSLIAYHEGRIDNTGNSGSTEDDQNTDDSVDMTPIVPNGGATQQTAQAKTTATEDLTPIEPPVENTANTAVRGASVFLNDVVNNSHGAPAEAVARMALYGGAVQAAIAANTSSYEAIAARTGVGATDMGLTVANNGMGAALWLAPMYKNQDSDSFDAEGLSYGVDMNLYGVALGADFEFMPGLTAGIMFNVGSGSADGQGNAAASSVSNDFDYYGISVYGNYKYDALSITADLGYTAVDSDIDAHTGLDSYGSVSTSVDSTAWTLGVTGKYTFNLGGVELAPHAGLRYSSIDLDDYSVSDIASYDADTMDIFSIPVGVTIAKEFSGEAWTVKPSLDLSVQGNFGDDTSDGTVHWTGVDGLATNVSSEMMDNFTYGATLGVSAQTGSFSMGLGVNYTGSDNVDEFGVNANARFVF